MEGIERETAGRNVKTIQQEFLDAITGNNRQVTVFLVNGVRLQGSLSRYDNKCILLQGREQCQLIYKHAISTVMPDKHVEIAKSED